MVVHDHAETVAPAITGDRPIEDPADDRLGFALFAERLANSLLLQETTSGLVVGIHGSWGSGKTTLLNFVLHYLDELTREAGQPPDGSAPSDNQNLLIVRYNPWWFTGREDLALRLLDQFRASLAGEDERTRKVRESLGDLSDALSSAPFGVLEKIGFFGKQVFKRHQDVIKIKKKIADALSAGKRRVVFVIDDVDRLNAEELRHLFGVIKAIGDFPRTLYLVAFDRAVVAAALSDIPGVSGSDYLEKIVQIPFELPMPNPSSLRGLLFERLDSILVATPDELFDQGRWAEVYWSGIDNYIQTPRDIDQLANAISLTYPSVVTEVNAVDFFGIECLRVHAPEAYAVVRNNSSQLAGTISSPSGLGQADPTRVFHDSWLDALGQGERVKAEGLLKALFPKFNAALGGPNPGQGLEARWNTELRVCSEERFPVYFQLAPPAGIAPAGQVRAALSLAEADPHQLSRYLLELSEPQPGARSAARPLLESLVDHAEVGLPEATAKGLLRSLFDVGDELLASEPRYLGLAEFEIDMLIGRILYRVLPRMSEGERYLLLKELVADGKALAIIVHEIAVLGQSLGKYGSSPSLPSDQLVTESQLADLEALALGRIRESAEDGSLRWTPDLAAIMYRWRDWGSEAEVRKWTEALISEDEGLFLLMDAFLSESTIYSGEAPRVTKYHFLDPKALEPFVDPESLTKRVQTLLNAPLEENKSLSLRKFLEGVEARRRGEDPRDAYRQRT